MLNHIMQQAKRLSDFADLMSYSERMEITESNTQIGNRLHILWALAMNDHHRKHDKNMAATAAHKAAKRKAVQA